MKVRELRRLIDALPDQAEVLVEINETGLLLRARAQVGLAKWLEQDPETNQTRFVLATSGAVPSRPEDGDALVIGR